MRIIRKVWMRIHFALNRRRFERELADEMDAHRQMMTGERCAHFGNAPRLREESREAWSWIWFDQFRQDLTYAFRVLWSAPGFTLGAVAVLALGIGVNLAEFEIFDAMLFHRLNFRDVNSTLQFSRVSRDGPRLGFSSGAVEFYRRQNHSFAWLISEDSTAEVVVEADADVRLNLVSANYFGSLGVIPAWGRLLDSGDAQPDAPPAAVLGYQYWQARWAADPHVVGRIVHINNKPVRIVGVAPYSFDGLAPTRTAVWFPVTKRSLLLADGTAPEVDFSHIRQMLFGKMKPGVPQAAGEAELTALGRELIRKSPPSWPRGERIQATLVQESMIRSAERSPAMAIFIVMILLILLSACANLGNMLLARGLARQREIGVRLALGAGRARILRQLMTENFLLALIGSAAALALGAVSARLLLHALDAPPSIHVSMSWSLVTAGFALSVLSAIAFGLPSALQTVRPNRRKIHLRQTLVGVQVAVSCLLLIASGVLARNGIVSASVDLAFDYRNMLVVYPRLYAVEMPASLVRQKLDALSLRMNSLPGVQSVTAAVVPPLSGRPHIQSLPGLPRIYVNSVAPSYFEVLNLPVVRGRTFLPEDNEAVIVSESAARAVWPNLDPIGRTWNLGGIQRTVTAVVKDSGANLLADADSIEAYLPMRGRDFAESALILHTRGDPSSLVRLVPAAAATSDETVSASLMSAFRDSYLESQRKLVGLIGSIGAVATTLAGAGMFALIAFAVAQRKRELGIRIALGARPLHILRVLLTQNARPTAIGAVAGIILALILSRLVRSIVVLQDRFGAQLTGFAAGLAFFAIVAALATLSPALRALRIDPSSTLREE